MGWERYGGTWSAVHRGFRCAVLLNGVCLPKRLPDRGRLRLETSGWEVQHSG